MPVERLGVEGASNAGVKGEIQVHRPGFFPRQGRNDKLAASTVFPVISQN
jgi:hypothetical protein